MRTGSSAFNGRRWTYTKLLPANEAGTAPEVIGAACAPRSEFCLATTDNGRVFSYNGTQWSRSAPIGGLSPNDVSCASARLCVAVDGSGSAAIGT
jgi:hypothetical protein